jgi:hypothetical protein
MKVVQSIASTAILLCALAGCTKDSGPALGPQATTRSISNFPPVVDDDCGLPVAPDNQRVDLITPSFSNPLDADNPLFPVGELDRVVLLGLSDGEPFRTETTRLAGAETIVINGTPVQTIISQYVAWTDRRIDEVALDWYGQDDEGHVWYFGEDVFNYDEGLVVDMEGTWRAGEDFPVAMIMPNNPQVGDVWRPENACPVVFEEVTAIQIGLTVEGPSGPVGGALLVKELHMDATYEDKIFAPGYGEFSTGSGQNIEALALAIPTDFLGGSTPEDLEDLSDDAEDMFSLARNGGWKQITALFDEMAEDWHDYEATGVPPLLATEMNTAIDALDEAINGRDKGGARQAAVDIALACLDFKLRYQDREDIDRELIEVWTLQLQIDRAAHDEGGIQSDLETIRIIRDRL